MAIGSGLAEVGWTQHRGDCRSGVGEPHRRRGRRCDGVRAPVIWRGWAFSAITGSDSGASLGSSGGGPATLYRGIVLAPVYLAMCRLLRVAELDEVVAMVRGRIPGLVDKADRHYP